MKKLIVLIAILANANVILKAQFSERQAQSLVGERIEVQSDDSKFSISLGGESILSFFQKADSNALFELLDNEGFGGISRVKQVNGNKFSEKEYVIGTSDGDSIYYIQRNAQWYKVNSKSEIILSYKQDVREEIAKARKSVFVSSDFKKNVYGDNEEIIESYIYKDAKGQQTELWVWFLNNELRAFSFSRI